MTKAKRRATERWSDAVAEAHADDDAEAKRLLAEVLALSDEDVERELAGAGVDVGALDAKADAGFDAFARNAANGAAKADAAKTDEDAGAWVAKVAPPATDARGPKHVRRRRTYALTVAAAAAAATAGVATYLATRPPDKTPDPTPDAGVRDAATTPEAPPSAERPAPVPQQTRPHDDSKATKRDKKGP